jgi:hypothetical protein
LETNNIEEQVTTEETTLNDPKAVLAALDRAKSDAKKFREEKQKLQVDLDSKDQKIAEYSGKLLREKLMQKLSDEGIREPKRLLKFIDTQLLSFDENLEVVGFEDQFSKLREDLPEIFDSKLRVGGQADTGIRASVSTQYTATQLQAAKILGKI